MLDYALVVRLLGVAYGFTVVCGVGCFTLLLMVGFDVDFAIRFCLVSDDLACVGCLRVGFLCVQFVL